MSSITKGHLMSAIFESDTKKFKKLLKSSKVLQLSILRGEYNILKMAVRRKRVKAAELLAKNCIKIRHKKLDRSSNTLLHDAVRLGQLKVVKILVSKGADVNVSIRNGMTPLHIATKHGYLKIMDYLLRNGADVNARCPGPYYVGFTPLHFACESRNLKYAKLLLKHKASVNPTNNDIHPIHISVGSLHLKMTQLLLDYGASMAVNKRFHLDHFQIKGFIMGFNARGYTRVEEATIRYGEDDLTLLHHAVTRYSIPMVKLLLAYGADVNILSNIGSSPLSDAVVDHNIQMVKFLLKNGALVNYDFDDCKKIVIRKVIKNQDGINIYYCKSQYSLKDKKLEIIKLLIDAGASSKVSDNDYSLLFYFILFGYREIVNYLLYHTDFNFFYIDNYPVFLALFNEDLIDQTPEIANDTEYITKRKLECKELFYDLIADRYSKYSIGFPKETEISYQILTESPFNLKITKEEHEDRIEQIKKKFQGIVHDLKREKIGDSYITFYHILTANSYQLIRFGLNEDFRALRIDDYKEKYFIYFNILKNRIQYAVNNGLSLEIHNKFVYSLFKNVLPYDCCEKIVTYLDYIKLKAKSDVFK
ncbi:putative ankyrin repeat protein RF_0381 [Microplitis demolitor]|uniref:putative ankyrin repeat protein RF_0381 n=1 Tax=Microplitis demolitor TaxID=69319 RepID=UPI00235B654A|nr:putative ankyrin repeat protein RF_0381 [Microplitis demolitor]